MHQWAFSNCVGHELIHFQQDNKEINCICMRRILPWLHSAKAPSIFPFHYCPIHVKPWELSRDKILVNLWIWIPCIAGNTGNVTHKVSSRWGYDIICMYSSRYFLPLRWMLMIYLIMIQTAIPIRKCVKLIDIIPKSFIGGMRRRSSFTRGVHAFWSPIQRVTRLLQVRCWT